METPTSKPHITPKDFFLWAGAMVALYWSATSLILLIFQYIDRLFPSNLDYYIDPYSGTIRFAMASLLIVFPMYLFLTRTLNRELRTTPEKKELWVRKWLIFLTLFVAGGTLVIDLIMLINEFLGGDLEMRFVLKVATVFVVIGAVFLYYLADLRGKWESEPVRAKMVGVIAGLIVLGSIVSGFFIIGLPSDQRDFRFDQERVNDLQSIQWQIIDFWRTKERLPNTLDELSDPLVGFIVPKDPETGAGYEYTTKEKLSFELCATFTKESIHTTTEMRVYDGLTEDWKHPAGKHCFERTVDPERFPQVDGKPVPAILR
jgi:hypothetical protein